MNALSEQAADIAQKYDWPEYPGVVDELRRGVVPDGFSRLVGQTVSLFMNAPPLGGMYRNRWAYEAERAEDKQTGRELARLRMLLAQINMANKEPGGHVHDFRMSMDCGTLVCKCGAWQ